ncbi:MAG: ABC transporter ATP-binding protein [Lachnospiraceae bacterium]|nr:ABC transporter ATP-binding protein [Candidatus Minthocola equi]
MIDVRNLSKSFDGYKALEEANIHVGSGNIYGLVGPNGAGKSTVIRHILGVYKGDSGEVLVGGEPVWENPKVKARIASIPDDLFYYTQASVSDMMHIYKGIYPNFSTLRYEKLKEAFDIDEKRMIRTLSKGMQKQVAFWLALSTMPDYLILDEPVDGLDPVMRRRVWSLMMNDVTERGTTVLVSSHNLRELEDVCDHVGIMDKGRVICERSLTELQENMVKMQVVFKDGFTELPPELNVISSTNIGRVHTLIMRTNAVKAKELLSACDPILVDALPLTLEEIFIYELGGDDTNVKDLII